jgi:hypothetical protein
MIAQLKTLLYTQMKNFKNVSLSQKTLKTGVGVGKLFVFS